MHGSDLRFQSLLSVLNTHTKSFLRTLSRAILPQGSERNWGALQVSPLHLVAGLDPDLTYRSSTWFASFQIAASVPTVIWSQLVTRHYLSMGVRKAVITCNQGIDQVMRSRTHVHLGTSVWRIRRTPWWSWSGRTSYTVTVSLQAPTSYTGKLGNAGVWRAAGPCHEPGRLSGIKIGAIVTGVRT